MDTAQWVSIHIRDRLEKGEISIKDAFLYEGAFHTPDDKSKALTEDDIDKLTIPSEGIGEVCARGRRGSEGWLDLYDGESKICELHWDNREKILNNQFEISESDKKYKIEYSGWSPQAGPLGHVFIDISAANNK
ncbi:aegerolysin family protein [Aspergillus candidus]|uniref:Terrelysin n=1 Tax=Aspergillus candidus TaxID=41067 RepID=A0A2I2EZ96_ASPCN|nr:Terrelysin [Aspergillus candidus]PLB33706.1 Terrelysin [Aspergillus candidus]